MPTASPPERPTCCCSLVACSSPPCFCMTVWSGSPNVGYLKSINYVSPDLMSILARVVEWIIVISLVLGLGTRYGALLGLAFVVIATRDRASLVGFSAARAAHAVRVPGQKPRRRRRAPGAVRDGWWPSSASITSSQADARQLLRSSSETGDAHHVGLRAIARPHICFRSYSSFSVIFSSPTSPATPPIRRS